LVIREKPRPAAHEHWDQASVLKQVGLLTHPSLPVFGAETASKVWGRDNANPSG
jgi:carboxymethylenebutenolidase